MREIRQSGSEGGEGLMPPLLPLSRAYASPNRIPACPGAATYAISLNTQALKVAWNK